MSASEALSVMQSSIIVVAKVAATILLLSMAVGIVISIFQAATQINEQTITFVPKLLLIALVLFAAGSWMLRVISDYAGQIFQMMQG